MPPKKQSGGPSKKTVEKVKAKIVEDKTFGLKNKNKSKVVQKHIQSVAAQVQGTKSKKQLETEYKKKEDEKKEKERQSLEREISKPAITQAKVPLGVAPKSVVCEFFKLGLCTKGEKCKFSHNIEQNRKAEKIDIYTDRRQADLPSDTEEKNETMETWDQTKLERVVESKQTEENKEIKTKIVCKHFLEAIESRKYGWFWECPNGGEKCMYVHALPPGFVLKATKSRDEQEEEQPIPIEEQIEQERSKLTKRTPITLELFLKWKTDKTKEVETKKEAAREKRELDIKAGKLMRSGREMFSFDPSLFVDEEDVIDTEDLGPNDLENEGPVINVDVTGTSITLTFSNNDNSSTLATDSASNTLDNGVLENIEGRDNSQPTDTLNFKDIADALQEQPDVEIQENLFVDDVDIPDEVE